MDSLVYICHCVSDKEMVSVLKAALEKEGVGIWCDERIIRGGDPLQPEARNAIENARAFVLVISPKAQSSKWVREETQFALQVAGENGEHPRILPILINGAEMGALKWLFPDDARPLEIENTPGSVAASMPQIIQALGPL